MGESEQHAQLVVRIVDYVRRLHGSNDGLSLLVDSRIVAPERRPGRIGGFTPDVHCRTIPSSFTILGEAKSFSDFYAPHTELQLSAFIEFLKTEADPLLIVAVPLQLVGAGHSLTRRVARRLDARHLPVVVLFG
jgi:hypothetical protein